MKPRIIYPPSAISILLRIFLLLSILVAVFIYAFEIGKNTKLESNLLESLLSDRVCGSQQDLAQINDALRVRVTNLERFAQVDRHATLESKERAKELETKILALKSQLAFYQKIIAPSEEESGLRLQNFTISAMEKSKPDHYSYKVVLSRIEQSNDLVKGSLSLRVYGRTKNKEKTLLLSEISLRSLKNHKLKFKFYQDIEGDVKLPKNFVPDVLELEINPIGKDVKHFSKKFQWVVK